MQRSTTRASEARARPGAVVMTVWVMVSAAATLGAQLPGRPSDTTARAPGAPRPTRPGVRQLMCRGAPGAFKFSVTANPSPRVWSYVEMRLEYRRSSLPPGGNWTSLEPGTCSWYDRTGRLVEPGYVLFDTHANAQPAPSAAQRQKQILTGTTQPAPDLSATAADQYPDTLSIPRYLSDQSRFWVFYVYDAGPQVAISHTAYRPTLVERVATQEATVGLTKPTVAATTWPIADVQVTQGLDGAYIRFSAGRDAKPVVQISKDPTIRDPRTGRDYFANPTRLGVVASLDGLRGKYSAQAVRLERNTLYRYLIDIPAAGESRPAQQFFGTFRTLRQQVKVVFTEVHMIDDSDALGSGELEFWFTANPGEPTAKKSQRGRLPSAPLDWTSGETYTVEPQITFWVFNAPDRLRLLVSGTDDDEELLNPPLVGEPSSYDESPTSDPHWDQNIAKGEFNLAARSDREYTVPFTLRSMDGNSLRFEVRGFFEVSRF